MAELLNYKCPHCDAPIQFDSTAQRMKCPYCDSEFDVEALRSKDEVLNTQPADEFNWEKPNEDGWTEEEVNGMSVFVCKACGGEIVGDSNTAATSCPYCGNPVVMSGRLSGTLKPDFVIPFQLNKDQAKQALKDYIGAKKFAPNTLKSENKIKEIKGLYVPFWLFDSDINASMIFEGTKVRTWSDSKYRYTETSFYNIFREGEMSFSNIPVDGSSKMPDDLMESIEPYDFSKAVDFQTAYLAGFLADKYDVTMENSVGRANDRVKTSAEETLRSTVDGFTALKTLSNTVQVKKGTAKYAMYPVWLLNTNYQGQMLTFAMNGQTGKIVGNIPVSKAKLAGLFAGLTAGVGVIVYLVGGLLGMF